MRVFVTGGTGVLGQPVIRKLQRSGHEIFAVSRSISNDKVLRQLGAVPVRTEIFQARCLLPHLQGCDAVLHLATRIPKSADLRNPRAWVSNNLIREVGTRALVGAALASDSVRVFVYPSICAIYSDGGDLWQSVDTGTIEANALTDSTLLAEQAVGEFAESAEDNRGITLRFGTFYGQQSRDSQQQLAMARKHLAIPLADPAAYRSMIWIDDAAAAVVAAFNKAPSGIYDVAEDQPITQARATQAVSRAVGKRAVFTVPRFLLRLALSPDLCRLLGRSQRISSDRFKDATGWAPSVPDQYVGWRRLAAVVQSQPVRQSMLGAVIGRLRAPHRCRKVHDEH